MYKGRKPRPRTDPALRPSDGLQEPKSKGIFVDIALVTDESETSMAAIQQIIKELRDAGFVLGKPNEMLKKEPLTSEIVEEIKDLNLTYQDAQYLYKAMRKDKCWVKRPERLEILHKLTMRSSREREKEVARVTQKMEDAGISIVKASDRATLVYMFQGDKVVKVFIRPINPGERISWVSPPEDTVDTYVFHELHGSVRRPAGGSVHEPRHRK